MKTDKHSFLAELGLSIMCHRKRKKLTITELAELTGIEKNTLRKIEKGEYEPTVDILLIICRILRISLKDMFYFIK